MSAIYPFVSRLKIVDKNIQTHTLGRIMTHPQRLLIADVEQDIKDGRPIRYITLKARQVGISTVTEAMAFQFAFCINRMRGLIVSHTGDSTKHLIDMTHHYWESWWARSLYTTTSSARDRLKWAPTQSEITLLPAKSAEGARSRTLHFVHGSEVAFWPYPELLLKALNQGVPRTALSAIFLESTANGIGNHFHAIWEAAKRGDVEYKPRFYPWWSHPSYTGHHIGKAEEARTLRLARVANGGTLDEEEWHLYVHLHSLHKSDAEIRSRLIWRRSTLNTELAGDIDALHQEYPSTDGEAFLSTGRNVFNLQYLRAVYEPMIPDIGYLVYDPLARNHVRFIKDGEGPLHVFFHPSPDPRAWYAIGADPSKATLFGDYAVGQVLYRNTLEQMATFRERGMNPVLFAEQMILLGYYYNTALLVPEHNMSGAQTAAIIESKYPKFYRHRKSQQIRGMEDNVVGWITTEQSKAEAIANLQREVFAGYEGRSGFKIHDQQTYYEMKNYIINDKAKFENAKHANHDDTVMSLAIGVSGTIYERPSMPNDQFTDPAWLRMDRGLHHNSPEHELVQDGMMQVTGAQGGGTGPVSPIPAPVSQTVTRGDGSVGLGMTLPPEVFPWAREGDVDMFSDGEY